MQDLLQGCMAEDRGLDAKSFQEIFCAHCRNPGCQLAKWGMDKFGARVAVQVDRLLNPLRIDARDYAALADFPDMSEYAEAIAAAEQKGDWSVPEIPIKDGNTETATLTTTSAVDAAAQVLARSRGQEMNLEPPEQTPVPTEFPEDTEALMGGTPVPEPVPEPEPPSKKEAPSPHPPTGNTEVPSGGLMLDEGPPPASPHIPQGDPWTASPVVDNLVKPGARIQLGGKK